MTSLTKQCHAVFEITFYVFFIIIIIVIIIIIIIVIIIIIIIIIIILFLFFQWAVFVVLFSESLMEANRLK